MIDIKNMKLLCEGDSDLTLSIASGGVIIDSNKVLLVRGRGSSSFKFPGGTVRDGESFWQTARREALEEVGCEVEVRSKPIFYLVEKGDTERILLVHYRAEILSGSPTLSGEIEEVQWFDIDNISQVGCFENVYEVLGEVGKAGV